MKAIRPAQSKSSPLSILRGALEWLIFSLLVASQVVSSSPRPSSQIDSARAYTRAREFNYEAWTLDAVWLKLQQSALGLPRYISREDESVVVMEYLRVTESIVGAENRLAVLFADPAITDKDAASSVLRAQLSKLHARQNELAPLAESVIQTQVAETLATFELTLGGQTIPPVLYHVSSLPMNLVISRRDKIQQIAAISLKPDVSLDEQVSIEEKVAQILDHSTLVVPVGGIGAYPTMVMQTPYFEWQVSTVVHEWVHNFLSMRPLGFLYGSTPELRTMNETAASIVENEVGPFVIHNFYPQLSASRADLGRVTWSPSSIRAEETPFDFRAEMHITRVRADELLAAGKIEEAESYMEQRRQFFWDNGYAIRKLNQAYFAFYGAYADAPGGAAGEDPVGPAVRALRQQSASLVDFLNTISWMTSFEELLTAVRQ